MAGTGPNWQGLLKWSLSHSDGTSSARQLSDEDRKWFMEAMQGQTLDVIRRMKEISTVMNVPADVLQAQGVTDDDLEAMLEELQSHVESIDMANDLHAIGGLVPLLNYLKNPNARIRARASEVVSTMVQNNPKCQQLVMEEKGLESLLSNFMSDPDMTVRTKSLGAISSLIRNNKPGVAAFRLGNGFTGLKNAVVSDNSRLQRKGLQVLQYLLHENPNDNAVAADLGFIRLLTGLVNNADADIRQAALHNLVEMAQNGKVGGLAPASEDSSAVRQALASQIANIESMPAEELGPLKEERMLLDNLWQACFDEPSSLREHGLLVLPGDNEPLPDVASRMFEPPLRAWAVPKERSEPQEDPTAQKPPLLLGHLLKFVS
ncbi:hypothetical protein GOP47_0012258 [Adiantum capillus-veneris]|uniref:TOG domain-containing protein n=1 Tax=Adiantum capillus-veneris TaxID=13818 RepID=A0A9D4UQU8_ADICA|nr:hypothetical protein GOP47_0012258 [Adiantum capillus-veneris]